MKKYLVKIYWEMSGFVEVRADSPKHAANCAITVAAEKLPDDAQFVPDSLNVDEEIDVIEAN